MKINKTKKTITIIWGFIPKWQHIVRVYFELSQLDNGFHKRYKLAFSEANLASF